MRSMINSANSFNEVGFWFHSMNSRRYCETSLLLDRNDVKIIACD
jgi:hypothetical protein